MSNIIKKLQSSYIHGIAKSMDINNKIQVTDKISSPTIHSTWINIGNEISNAMIEQSQLVLKSQVVTNDKTIDMLTKISAVNQTVLGNINNIATTSSLQTLTEKLTKISAMNQTFPGNIDNIATTSSLQTLTEKLTKISAVNQTVLGNINNIATTSSLQTLTEKLTKISAMNQTLLGDINNKTIISNVKTLTEKLNSLKGLEYE